ncbi:cysteine desulfurase NifS [Aminithiophilus ramosus]|uniref:Cysteine desulfurase IscS n=2 Tax=Synergistales TaxID=649776 RepID=A0A9Q7EX03_9BACT|nr:cysteine desulfurase NifS [Aminithiophilus ramosus]QTX32080.1 cysteine desulfurase NifS [Aminithiophilus ramosus]QVL35946.1 cysteine desulfurase NifS [Synergistota bacterium]
MKAGIYMDYAATTFAAPEVVEAMMPYFTDSFENPSSLYSRSDGNKKALAEARRRVAAVIGAAPEEIYFTGSGSEADNWALKGAAFSPRRRGKHVVTTAVEHKAILETGHFLERNGFDVTYLPVDGKGLVRLDDVKAALRDDTVLLSVMFANNEVGAVQPVAELGALCRERGILFHTDAVQAATHLSIDVEAMKIDLLSMAAHKFYGPKGVGALYIRRGVVLDNLVHGGGQEKGRRAGTENVPLIVGMGKAAEMAMAEMEVERGRIASLRDDLIAKLRRAIPYARLNGPEGESRLPNNVNMSFIGVEGETLLLDLDLAGISASTGSACASASLEPSHVLMAMGLSHEEAHGSVRLTLGRRTTIAEIDAVVTALTEIVARRRAMSPLWEDFLKTKEA